MNYFIILVDIKYTAIKSKKVLIRKKLNCNILTKRPKVQNLKKYNKFQNKNTSYHILEEHNKKKSLPVKFQTYGKLFIIL